MVGFIYYNNFQQAVSVTPLNFEDTWIWEGLNEIITLELVQNNEDIKFTDFYNIVKQKEGINIFDVMYTAFLDVTDIDSFWLFVNEYSSFRIVNGIVKLEDKELWDKYWEFQYWLLIQDGNLDVTTDEFSQQLDALFLSISSWNDIIPTMENIWVDMNVFFSTIELNEGLEWCTTLASTDEYYSNVKSCEDKIYFYRSTVENNYCDEISDDYKKTMCNDFLEFSLQK